MKINKVLKNILNVILNIFSGWLCFWIFVYALFLITDRKDADDEWIAPLGYFMFVAGILVFIVPKIVLFIIKETRIIKDCVISLIVSTRKQS